MRSIQSMRASEQAAIPNRSSFRRLSKRDPRRYSSLPADFRAPRAIAIMNKTRRPMPLARGLSILAVLAAGCAASPPGPAPESAPQPAAPQPAAAPVPAAPAIVAAAFGDAVARAGE